MIYIVLGFHKSGTTLIAKTLHESGIDMGTDCQGDYKHCKYEDRRAQNIARDILYDGQPRVSYQMPWSYNDRSGDIKSYIDYRKYNHHHWGFKVPDITLCYEMWRPYLPPHVLIGVKRDITGVLAHYDKRHKNRPSAGQVRFAKHVYDSFIDLYVPPENIVQFENLLTEGPALLERIGGLNNLKDVRRI